MDNRWRFLYRIYSELWGRRRKAQAGDGRTGTSGVGDVLANPHINLKTCQNSIFRHNETQENEQDLIGDERENVSMRF
jgi:hypothetical protein